MLVGPKACQPAYLHTRKHAGRVPPSPKAHRPFRKLAGQWRTSVPASVPVGLKACRLACLCPRKHAGRGTSVPEAQAVPKACRSAYVRSGERASRRASVPESAPAVITPSSGQQELFAAWRRTRPPVPQVGPIAEPRVPFWLINADERPCGHPSVR